MRSSNEARHVRLAVTAVLFLAWIGYLVYLAAMTTRPVVLSRPQFLVAELYVIAELRTGLTEAVPAEEATIREVVWSASPLPAFGASTAGLLGSPFGTGPLLEVAALFPGRAALLQEDLKGKKIVVLNLPKADRESGWAGPGDYILALTRSVEGSRLAYRVTRLPRSPGFPTLRTTDSQLESTIYPATPRTLQQLERIKAEYHPPTSG